MPKFTIVRSLAVAAFLALATTFSFAQVSLGKPLSSRDLVGMWVDDEMQEGDFVKFSENGNVSIRLKGEEVGVAMPPGVRFIFRLDAAKSPMWLDLVALSDAGKDLFIIKSIVEIIGENTIRMASTSDDSDSRPVGFSDPEIASISILRKR